MMGKCREIHYILFLRASQYRYAKAAVKHFEDLPAAEKKIPPFTKRTEDKSHGDLSSVNKSMALLATISS
jgi:hypothetical protein